MRNYSLFALVASLLLPIACDAGDSTGDGASGGSGLAGASPTGAAGATGRAGSSAGTGGQASVGSAGAGTAGAGAAGAGAAGSAGAVGVAGGSSGLRLGTGGPFAFPQNKKPTSCSLTSVANASASVQAAYTSWKNAFVTASGAGSGLRVQRNTNQNDTVSEGIGYGMIASVYMNDKPTFDGLLTYAKAHFDANGLMNWHLNSAGTQAGSDAGSATDGDEDMAWALLMASDQWSSASYLAEGVSMINAILGSSIASDGTLKPGDTWGGTTTTFPDYFAPSYFRVFAKATNNPNWSGAIVDRNYTILAKVSGTNGLVPDNTTTTGFELSKNYSYDACRTPWRIAMDYCENAEPRAKAYIDKIGPFFNGIGANNIGDGYTTGGSVTSNNHNMAFIGPAGVAGMVGYPTLLDAAFTFGANNSGGDTSYFGQSLRVLTMLMMSGNFVDYTKP
jgi:endo-1,4-beta-D-glucanase Y